MRKFSLTLMRFLPHSAGRDAALRRVGVPASGGGAGCNVWRHGGGCVAILQYLRRNIVSNKE